MATANRQSPQRSRHNRQRGFTLIEMSVALVIIGLVVGGVITGVYLSQTFAMRSQVSFLNEYASGLNAFRNKYNCLPGDCANAESVGLGVAGDAGRNGNGDGQVNSDTSMRSTASRMQETLNVPYHLSQAGLLSDLYNGSDAAWVNASWNLDGYIPKSRLRAGSHVSALTISPATLVGGASFGGNIFFLHGNYSVNATTLQSEEIQSRIYGYGVTAFEGFAIDSKLDDGLPFTGRVAGAHYPVGGPNFSSGRCYNNTNAYDVQGLRDGTLSNAIETSPNPNKIDCALGVRGMW